MNFTREEFESALATIPEDSLEDHNWLWRVNDWAKVNKMGARVMAHLRSSSAVDIARPLAPEFYDWLDRVFPVSEDARVLCEWDKEQRAWRQLPGQDDAAAG
ncbi:MAG TPA: hypothetical protein VGE50_09910 [Gammaproteobacteria bacterium]